MFSTLEFPTPLDDDTALGWDIEWNLLVRIQAECIKNGVGETPSLEQIEDVLKALKTMGDTNVDSSNGN